MVVLGHDRINRGRGNNDMSSQENKEANNNGGRNEDDRGFLELQACIPHLAENKRVSRLDILLEAINYIDVLHSTLLLKIQRGDLSADERTKLISSYLKNIVSESNKENY